MFFHHQFRTQSNIWVALTVLMGFLFLFWQLFDLHQAVHGHQAQREHGQVPAEGPAAAAALRRGRQALAAAAGPHPPLRHHPAGTAEKHIQLCSPAREHTNCVLRINRICMGRKPECYRRLLQKYSTVSELPWSLKSSWVPSSTSKMFNICMKHKKPFQLWAESAAWMGVLCCAL